MGSRVWVSRGWGATGLGQRISDLDLHSPVLESGVLESGGLESLGLQSSGNGFWIWICTCLSLSSIIEDPSIGDCCLGKFVIMPGGSGHGRGDH